MSIGPVGRTKIDMCRGLYPNIQPFGAFGERMSMGTSAAGEDIWRGTDDAIPIPADAGEAMEVVSTDAADAAAGTGVQSVNVDYLDADGNPGSEVIALNGTTAVALTLATVRHVQKLHATAVGSNGVAVGSVTIRNIGTPTDVYAIIAVGGNMSLNPSRMVPLGKKLLILNWHATESQDRRVAFRLRSTSDLDQIYPGTSLFKSAMYLAKGSLETSVCAVVPALAIVKVTGWGDAIGGEASCGWDGLLFNA